MASVSPSARCTSSRTTSSGAARLTCSRYPPTARCSRNRAAAGSPSRAGASVSSAASGCGSAGAATAARYRRTSVQGQPAGTPSCSGHRPMAVSQPWPARRWLTWLASAVLPAPASPVTSTIRVRPAAASTAARATWLSSESLPTYGADGAGLLTGEWTTGTDARGRAAGGADRCGAWARMPSSSARRAGPGSTPRSAASWARARRSTASASPWRPDWYSASASSRHASSRSGCSAVSRLRLATVCVARPSRSAASACISMAARRSSSSRDASRSAHCRPLNSSKAAPRQYASAAVSPECTAAGSSIPAA